MMRQQQAGRDRCRHWTRREPAGRRKHYGLVPPETAATMTGSNCCSAMIAGRLPGPPIMQLIGFRSRRGRERARGVRGHAGARGTTIRSAPCTAATPRRCSTPAWAARCTRRCRRARATRRWSSRSASCARSPPTPARCAPRARSSAAAGASRPPRAGSPMPAAGCSRTPPRRAWCSRCREAVAAELPPCMSRAPSIFNHAFYLFNRIAGAELQPDAALRVLLTAGR